MMARKDERVNLRLSSDVYEPYARLSELVGISVTQMMREFLTENLETVQALIVMAERANAGDKEGTKTAYRSLLNLFRTQIDHEVEVGLIPDNPEDYFKRRQVPADSTSNTVR
jgi:hypothetical protein